MFKKSKYLFSILILLFIISCSGNAVFAKANIVKYRTHVQNIGWTDYVEDGDISGTEGQSLRMEAFQIELLNSKDVGLSYKSHVQDIGWMNPVSEGEISGTEGLSKRVEAISINLTGNEAINYHIYYRVHCQNYGWLSWVKDGEYAGTAGQSLRLESMQVIVLPATNEAPKETSNNPGFIGNPNTEQVEIAEAEDTSGKINYRVFSNATGWTDYAKDEGQMGTTDRIEALEINLDPNLKNRGSLNYRTLEENNGWSNWVGEKAVSGAAGLGLQAIRIKLTGQLQYYYDVYYRTHVLGTGWTNWAKNGESCGTEGYGKNFSHIQVVLKNKGDYPSEGNVGNAFTQTKWAWPVPGNTSISSGFGPRNGSHHDGIDIPAASGTPIISCKSGVVKLSAPNGNFGNCVAIEQDSGENVYYAHMIRTNVSVGQRVSQGQVIGFVGTTGHSFGNHLHIEIYNDADNLVNPISFLR